MSDTISINNQEQSFLVYKHTNKINGKVYIGITHYQDPNKRWGKDGKGYIHNHEFTEDILKYGWNDGFIHEVIQSGLTEQDAELLEEKLILDCNSTDKNYGYNKNKSSVGHHEHFTSEIRKKIGKSRKGKSWTEIYGTEYQHPHFNKHWFTNGTISVHSTVCPEGFVKGSSLSGLNVYNNGHKEIRATECPDGFVKGGKLKGKSWTEIYGTEYQHPSIGRKWFTDGKTQIFINPNITKIPDGFYPGNLRSNKQNIGGEIVKQRKNLYVEYKKQGLFSGTWNEFQHYCKLNSIIS